MNRFLLLALTAGLSMHCLAQEKEIVYSDLPSFEKANVLAGVKTSVECLIELGGKYTKENLSTLYKSLGVTSSELSDPAVVLLSNEYKKYTSDDCRSIEENKSIKAAMRIDNQYDLRFKPENKTSLKIPLKEFTQASSLVAIDLCRANIGSRESLFVESNLPWDYAVNEFVQLAAEEIRPFISKDCLFLDETKEQVKEIISKYFEEQ